MDNPSQASTAATSRVPTDPGFPKMVGRIQSVDILRGIVMILMAIDHVRGYSGIPAGGPTPGIFFTRWITHFCAPAFVFFAGTSAFLYYTKINDKGKLARFLISISSFSCFCVSISTMPNLLWLASSGCWAGVWFYCRCS